MERDRVAADRGPQPRAARPVFPAKLLDAIAVGKRLKNVNPQAWLADVLDRIAGTPQSQLDELLPWNWQDSQRHDQAA